MGRGGAVPITQSPVTRGDWDSKNWRSNLLHDNIEERSAGDQAAVAGHGAASAVEPDGGGARPHHKNPVLAAAGSRGQRGETQRPRLGGGGGEDWRPL